MCGKVRDPRIPLSPPPWIRSPSSRDVPPPQSRGFPCRVQEPSRHLTLSRQMGALQCSTSALPPASIKFCKPLLESVYHGSQAPKFNNPEMRPQSAVRESRLQQSQSDPTLPNFVPAIAIGVPTQTRPQSAFQQRPLGDVSLISLSSCPEMQIAKVRERPQSAMPMLRKLSDVSLKYPREGRLPTGFGATPHRPLTAPPKRPPVPKSPVVSRPISQPQSEPPSPRHQHKRGGQTLWESARSKNLLLSRLADLRRAGLDTSMSSKSNDVSASASRQSSKEGSPARDESQSPGDKVEADLDCPLLHFTLQDTTDTEDFLEERVSAMKTALTNCEGSMHATVHFQGRALEVSEAKLKRLQKLRQRMEAYEVASRSPETTIQKLHAGDASMLDDSAFGFSKFLAKCVHDGPPEEADKSQFKHFIATFGLPEDHWMVEKAKEVLNGLTKKWIECVMQHAGELKGAAEQGGTGWDAPLRSLENGERLLRAVGVKSDHSVFKQIKGIKSEVSRKAAEEEGLRKRQQNADKRRAEAEARARAGKS